MKRSAVLAVTAAILLGGCSVDESTNADTPAGKAKASAKKNDSCGNKATRSCTPRVTSSGKVRVDTISYRVTGARSAAELGNKTYGLGESADGIFVVVNVSAMNGKSESVTLTDVFKLEVEGKTYDPSNEGTVAAMGAGDEPFFLKQIGPDVNAKGVVVFDIPKSRIGKKLELRLGELGFGSTHAYIRLPSLR